MIILITLYQYVLKIHFIFLFEYYYYLLIRIQDHNFYICQKYNIKQIINHTKMRLLKVKEIMMKRQNKFK